MAVALLVALTAWAFIFYVNMIDEVHDSIDDGLDNSKLLIIHQANLDSTVLAKQSFDEGNYAIRKIEGHHALNHYDVYKDTLMYMENEDDLEPVRLLTTVFEASENEFYQLKVISSMVEEDDLIEDLFYSLLWLYLILIVTILAINTVVLRSMWKPFFKFLNHLSEFKLGKNEQVQLLKSNVAEFKLLNKVIADVLESNIRSFHNQKQLIENASHELQTPLAIALNKLQLLAENPELSEEVVNEVFQTIETLQRLTRLNKSLLLLSKIENKQFLNEETIDFNDLIKSLLLDFKELIEFKELEVIFKKEDDLKVKMNPELARILITNLIKNAIRHNFNKGKIELLITNSSFQISNSGSDKELDSTKVFQRFQKESTDQSSTGLGLAIAKSIVDISGYRIEYAYSNSMHQFTVKFD
ncbi:integral membrane sensor signal transduction histidine kinase [Fluviicola taffensis DSM 16823]|uniref:histidine kinase n=2 Tax=Fluviicola TaxID=332102 RepID=F2ICM1_FLUTR|nr:integral membrane sensor signal transduction histidine kinase [Fluviicola taffensis DSM 16823]